jgi:hypothetical protein
VGQAAGEIVCKYFKINDLHENHGPIQSNPIKVNQTSFLRPCSSKCAFHLKREGPN